MMLHHTAGVAHRTQEIGKHDRQTVAELQKQVGAAPRRVFLAAVAARMSAVWCINEAPWLVNGGHGASLRCVSRPGGGAGEHHRHAARHEAAADQAAPRTGNRRRRR
jgi:hypothetical protein